MKHRIAFDTKLKRPGCVLVQAIMGGTVPELELLFDSKTWLLAPTPDMRVYEITDEQLKLLSEAYGRPKVRDRVRHQVPQGRRHRRRAGKGKRRLR